MQNVVVFDWDAQRDDPFVEEMTNETGKKWKALGLKKGKLFSLRSFIFILSLVINRKKYGDIVFWQQKHGILFSNICSLLNLKKANKVTVLTLIYHPENGFKGRIKKKLFENAICSDYIDLIICYSKHECTYYSELFDQPISKFESTLFGVSDEKENYDTTVSEEKYIVAAGNSNRDYEFLINSLKGTDFKAIIIDRTCRLTDTDNVKILRNISYGEELYDLLARSMTVAIPLADENISAGQTVIIQALMLGKPVIATKTNTINDYLVDGKCGFVIDKNKETFLEKLNIIYNNKDKYTEMSRLARQHYEDKFSYRALARSIARIIEKK